MATFSSAPLCTSFTKVDLIGHRCLQAVCMSIGKEILLVAHRTRRKRRALYKAEKFPKPNWMLTTVIPTLTRLFGHAHFSCTNCYKLDGHDGEPGFVDSADLLQHMFDQLLAANAVGIDITLIFATMEILERFRGWVLASAHSEASANLERRQRMKRKLMTMANVRKEECGIKSLKRSRLVADSVDTVKYDEAGVHSMIKSQSQHVADSVAEREPSELAEEDEAERMDDNIRIVDKCSDYPNQPIITVKHIRSAIRKILPSESVQRFLQVIAETIHNQ